LDASPLDHNSATDDVASSGGVAIRNSAMPYRQIVKLWNLTLSLQVCGLLHALDVSSSIVLF